MVNNVVSVLTLVLGLDFASPWIALVLGTLVAAFAVLWILGRGARKGTRTRPALA